MATNKQSNYDNADLPEYLKRWPGLYIRQDDKIVEALPEDIQVAKQYPTVKNKGKVVGGRRITLMCAKDIFTVGETVRILHVLEVLEPGQDIYVMGPKAIYGEYVDGKLATAEFLEEQVYDGRVLSSPGVDYNFDITTYSFSEPGRHEIYWQMGDLRSNNLELEIVPKD
ncbi:MAG: hypothetical protein JXA42_11370 [Anaerolineales bacterium]|nr:hypothetical protein [Anaerolineales bacterium]